jgi:Transposase domain (DUF772)
MMVALLLYAYAIGERSSRGIERRCRGDVAFRLITANRIPDHATIARFRARHEQALAATFTQVLALCARAGLVSVGVVALDGSLLAGNASPAATRSYASIREEVERMLAEAALTDAAEDERLGEARGDELPAELVDARSRRDRLRRCRQQLEQARADELAAYQANLAWRVAWEAAHERKLTGRKPTPPDPAAQAARKINTTDPDTRLMKRAGGKAVQGYNAYARPASKNQSGSCSPTAATGTRPRSRAYATAASTCSSRHRTGNEARRGNSHPGKARRCNGSTSCSRHPRDRRSTVDASRSSNPSLRTRNSSDASTASSAAATPPARPSGS